MLKIDDLKSNSQEELEIVKHSILIHYIYKCKVEIKWQIHNLFCGA